MARKPGLQRLCAVLLALAVWQAAAMAVDLELLLPSPVQVVARLWTLWREAGFWQTVAFSFLRIVLGFLCAFVLALLLAVPAGRWPLLETLLRPYVVCIKSVPVASFIIISLIWLRGGELAVFISFLMVFPVLYGNILQGIKSTDPQLLEMAKLYGIPWRRQLGYIYLPHVRPFLLSGCSVALGMAWKAGVAAEVIGVVSGSIGAKLYESKIYLQTADLLAWTVVIVLCSVLFEKTFLWLVKKAFAGWEKQ